jgi:hypothetical protein
LKDLIANSKELIALLRLLRALTDFASDRHGLVRRQTPPKGAQNIVPFSKQAAA